ncbi:MAG: hypothetical protein ABI652_03450 [Acidobacteriota bacterium]
MRALDDARRDAAARRTVVDEAKKAYEEFLENIAVPLMRQATIVLNAAGQVFAVHTPADSVRLVAENAPLTFIELELDVTRPEPQVIGRVSLTRGRQGLVVEERPIAKNIAVADLTEEHVSAFLMAEIPKLVMRT